MTKTSQFLRLSLSVVALATLAACGGGGGEGSEGPQHKIVSFDVLPGHSVDVMAGESLPLRMAAETYGPGLASMQWSVEPASGSAKGVLSLQEPDCASWQTSSRPVPSTQHVVATGACESRAIAPAGSAGAFTIVAKVSATDGTQRSERIAVNVVPKPVVHYDYAVQAQVEGEVAPGTPIKILASTVADLPLPQGATVSYDWSILSAPVAPSGGPIAEGSGEAVYLLPSHGTYLYLVKATVTQGESTQVKSVVVKLETASKSGDSAFDLVVDAETEQPHVFVGAPAKLVANFSMAEGVVASNVLYRWRQLTGPQAVMSAADGKSIFVIPSARGTAVFAVDVTILATGKHEVQTALVTVTAE